MLTPRTTLARRVTAALDASPSRIPVLVGGCGSGRTTLLRQLRERARARRPSQYIDVERTATTPERFLRAVTAVSPFPVADTSAAEPIGARGGVRRHAGACSRARARRPASRRPILLDEFLELRTFESFPGLRRVLHDCVDGLAASGNRFVLTSRYVARALRLLRDRSARFEVIHMPALTRRGHARHPRPDAGVATTPARDAAHDADYLARTVQALADGRPAYVRALADELAPMREHGGPGSGDAISALAALLARRRPAGASSAASATSCGCTARAATARSRRFSKSSAEEEGLTLTEISHRLQRTPGSTKDYLSWLEDVDLVTSRQKRYSYTDPLLRVWVRLHCRPSAPTEDDLAREVHRYALPRLPQPDRAAAGIPRPSPRSRWPADPSGIIEID